MLFDVVIVGAGPAGISASLRAAERGLKALTLERENVGGTVSKYPRQKLVMTSPVEFPLHGRFNKTTLSKEDLLAFWEKIMAANRSEHSYRRRRGRSLRRSRRPVSRAHAARRVQLARCGAGPGPSGNAAQTWREGRGAAPRPLPPHRGRSLHRQEYSGRRRRRQRGRSRHGPRTPDRQQSDALLSSRRIQPAEGSQCEAHCRAHDSRKIEVLFNSMPVEFRDGSVLLETGGQVRELPNDFVWIFAGGTPPSDFLKAAGVAFGTDASTNHNATSG